MKLSELIATLTKLQREHGDVDVYVHNDMIGDDPNPEYFPPTRWGCEGVYLN